MMGSDFESIIKRLPIDRDTLMSSAISWFIRRQDPEDVNFDVYQNGYRLEVKTDEENVKEAAEFWRDNVIPKLRGDED